MQRLTEKDFANLVGSSAHDLPGVCRELLEKYEDPYFVANILGIHNSNIYDWKNGRYMR